MGTYGDAVVAAGVQRRAELWSDVAHLAGCPHDRLDMAAVLAPSWDGTLDGLMDAATAICATGVPPRAEP